MAFMVESETSRRPHYVYIEKSGKITCENWPGWSSTKFCKHSVAVAEKTQNLEKFPEWLRRRSTPVNLTSLVTFDSGTGVGRKGNKTATSQRKGGRKARKDQVVNTLHKQRQQQREQQKQPQHRQQQHCQQQQQQQPMQQHQHEQQHGQQQPRQREQQLLQGQ